MRSFSRALAGWDMVRLAAVVLGTSWIVVLAGYAYAGVTGGFTADAAVAAAAALAIAGAGFMYAWREPAPLGR